MKRNVNHFLYHIITSGCYFIGCLMLRNSVHSHAWKAEICTHFMILGK